MTTMFDCNWPQDKNKTMRKKSVKTKKSNSKRVSQRERERHPHTNHNECKYNSMSRPGFYFFK